MSDRIASVLELAAKSFDVMTLCSLISIFDCDVKLNTHAMCSIFGKRTTTITFPFDSDEMVLTVVVSLTGLDAENVRKAESNEVLIKLLPDDTIIKLLKRISVTKIVQRSLYTTGNNATSSGVAKGFTNINNSDFTMENPTCPDAPMLEFSNAAAVVVDLLNLLGGYKPIPGNTHVVQLSLDL
jgi:hypothetical protein